MIKIFFNLVCFLLIILILFRIPEKDGGSLNISDLMSTGSKKTNVKFSQYLTWFLILIFFYLNSIIFLKNL
jgi:protein translocase SecG subunit